MKRTLEELLQWLAALSFIPGRSYNVRTLQSSSYMCVDFVETEFEAGEVRTYWSFGAGTLVVPIPWDTAVDVIESLVVDADDSCMLEPSSPQGDDVLDDSDDVLSQSLPPCPSPLARSTSEALHLPCHAHLVPPSPGPLVRCTTQGWDSPYHGVLDASSLHSPSTQDSYDSHDEM